jgi:hypothetical protein
LKSLTIRARIVPASIALKPAAATLAWIFVAIPFAVNFRCRAMNGFASSRMISSIPLQLAQSFADCTYLERVETLCG